MNDSRQQILVHRVRPERRQIIKDNLRRPAYRCGYGRMDGVEWIQWRSSTLGLMEEDRVYPVFVQSHVFHQLRGRVGHVFGNQGIEGHLHMYLAFSLDDPVILPNRRNDGSVLVEYHLGNHKVGYLVARKLDDLILVETFLFLTMDGTPEGDRFRRQLQLDRPGKEYAGLDDLWTYLLSDAVLDPDLVDLLGKCGCGHLFEMSKALEINEFEPGHAHYIRSVLRLKPK